MKKRIDTAFELQSQFEPTGDQPKAINKLVQGLEDGLRFQTLLGVTGSGKTFTMAQVIQKTQRPALILAHNKTLAAQLYSEFKEFFPQNRVEYFVSYYDYYQPEAYIASRDLYIEKDSSINEEIERLRHSATMSLLSQKDVIIVSSVSCIYGLGSPEEYGRAAFEIEQGQKITRREMLERFTAMQYLRNDIDFSRGKFRVRGDIIDLFPSYGEKGYRIDMFGQEIESIKIFDPLTGEVEKKIKSVVLFPATHFVTSGQKLKIAIKSIEQELEETLKNMKKEGLNFEAQRLEQRTRFDIEMLMETGYCTGIENYSRHFDGRSPGQPPYVLLDFFPSDFLVFVDESHISIPQIGGMYAGDRSRKENLVRYGFRLPSALDNRPLKFPEFLERTGQIVMVSATPGQFEKDNTPTMVEQIIRPTGLVDPVVEVRSSDIQVNDTVEEIKKRVSKGQRALVTTVTKKLAEKLADYLQDQGIKANYLHSDVKTIERVDILRDLRLGSYDVIVGINLLREGLDLPEVTFVAILDADKQGFLRSTTSLIQTIGRAARHSQGRVIMYANKTTPAMKQAIDETNRRRQIQVEYNQKHNITPKTIKKRIQERMGQEQEAKSVKKKGDISLERIDQMTKQELINLVKELEKNMNQAVMRLEFEEAGIIRDQLIILRKKISNF